MNGEREREREQWKELDDTVTATTLLGKAGKTEEIWSGCVDK